MSGRKKILVTNDDGITAPGIAALVEVAKEFGEVIVVAPDSPQSGQGHAITIYEPLRLKKQEIFPGIEAYACTGTPVDCVKLAKNVLLNDVKPDLCVSGINHGSNAGVNILYSGTMSAAMEASIEGIPSIGFSLMDFAMDADFAPSQHYARKIIKAVLEKEMVEAKLLNVNIPHLPMSDIKGIKVCSQANARWVEDYKEGEDPRGGKYYWLAGNFVDSDPENHGGDVRALNTGYVSIVPSMHDLTRFEAIPELKYMESL